MNGIIWARQYIKEHGYVNSIELTVAAFDKGHDLADIENVMDKIPCSKEGIYRVEYTNTTASGRVKDLFYWNP